MTGLVDRPPDASAFAQDRRGHPVPFADDILHGRVEQL
jgi:hypothetical protein